MYLVLGYILLLPEQYAASCSNSDGSELSLLTPPPGGIARAKFYADDVFGACKDFYEAYELLDQHLLPRIAWSKLKLSFKKLELFMDEITILRVIHYIHIIIKTKEARSIRISQFPTLTDTKGVRSFLATI